MSIHFLKILKICFHFLIMGYCVSTAEGKKILNTFWIQAVTQQNVGLYFTSLSVLFLPRLSPWQLTVSSKSIGTVAHFVVVRATDQERCLPPPCRIHKSYHQDCRLKSHWFTTRLNRPPDAAIKDAIEVSVYGHVAPDHMLLAKDSKTVTKYTVSVSMYIFKIIVWYGLTITSVPA